MKKNGGNGGSRIPDTQNAQRDGQVHFLFRVQWAGIVAGIFGPDVDDFNRRVRQAVALGSVRLAALRESSFSVRSLTPGAPESNIPYPYCIGSIYKLICLQETEPVVVIQADKEKGSFDLKDEGLLLLSWIQLAHLTDNFRVHWTSHKTIQRRRSGKVRRKIF